MGYSERGCQLCGVSFNIGRARTHDEPPEAAWNESGSGYVSLEGRDPCGDGCSDIHRQGSDEDEPEHIAGPNCEQPHGYNGHRISADEMRAITYVQCLLPKQDDWKPEPGDEEFEKEAQICFVSGISTEGASEFDIQGLNPVKHGVQDSLINNVNDSTQGDPNWGLPVHPRCFEMFKKMSLEKFGKVDIDGLWVLRDEQGSFEKEGFDNFTRAPDLDIVLEQWYLCEPGTEYLAADPINVAGLDTLISSCTLSEGKRSDVVFTVQTRASQGHDPFAAFSPELNQMVIEYLSRKDVANLRLASRSFTQLPQTYFQGLVKAEMPWVWEVDSLQPKEVDWYDLWCRLSDADGGSEVDQKERKWKRDILLSENEKLHENMRERGIIGAGPNGEYMETWQEESKKKQERIDAEIQKGYDAGMWPAHKRNTLKGLRNRRRIFKDIEEILRRIADLERD